jgi:hypothetical protein
MDKFAIYLSILFLSTILSTPAGATLSSFQEWKEKRKVLCETRLTAPLANLASVATRKSISQMQTFSIDVASMVTDAALIKVGIDDQTGWQKTSPIFLKFEAAGSGWVARISLNDVHPAIWRTLLLDKSQENLNYRQLLEEFPLSENQLEDQDGVIFGSRSDADGDGVRSFISIDKKRGSTLGIDVPCDEVGKYLTGPVSTRHVLTPFAEFCRIDIVSFK